MHWAHFNFSTHMLCYIVTMPDPSIKLRAIGGFSCEVIWSQLCKSLHSQPPCWFPLPIILYEKHNKMFKNFLFRVCIIIPNYNRVTRIFTHTLEWNLKFYMWSESNITTSLAVFSPYHVVEKGNQEVGQNYAHMTVYRVM